MGYDVAVVTLNKRSAPSTVIETGVATGWLGFCHTNCLQPFWQLSQIGFPGNYDGGNRMQYGEHIEQSDTRDYITARACKAVRVAGRITPISAR